MITIFYFKRRLTLKLSHYIIFPHQTRWGYDSSWWFIQSVHGKAFDSLLAGSEWPGDKLSKYLSALLLSNESWVGLPLAPSAPLPGAGSNYHLRRVDYGWQFANPVFRHLIQVPLINSNGVFHRKWEGIRNNTHTHPSQWHVYSTPLQSCPLRGLMDRHHQSDVKLYLRIALSPKAKNTGDGVWDFNRCPTSEPWFLGKNATI